MTVRDLIEHLQTLPADLPVVQRWDEGGTYHDKTAFPREMDVVKSTSPLSYDGTKWTDDEEGYEVHARRRVVSL